MNDHPVPVYAAMYDIYAAKRDEKGLTDYMVAKKAGFDPASIYAWKAGKYMPKYPKLSAITEVLGCSIWDLLTPKKEGGEDAQSNAGSLGGQSP